MSENREKLRLLAVAQKRGTRSKKAVSTFIKAVGWRKFAALPEEEKEGLMESARYTPLHRSRNNHGQYVRVLGDAPLIALGPAEDPKTPEKPRLKLNAKNLARIGQSCLDMFQEEMVTPSKTDSKELRFARRTLKGLRVQILKKAGLRRGSLSKIFAGPSVSRYVWANGCSGERREYVRPPRLSGDEIIAEMTPFVKESCRFSDRCKRRFKQLCGSLARSGDGSTCQ